MTKQLLTTFKTIVLLSMLGVWQSAWGETRTLTLYPTGDANPLNLAQWSYHKDLSTSQDSDPTTYVGFTNQGGANNYRSLHLKFYNTGSDFYDDYDSYTVSFDFWNNNAWSNTYSSTAEIVMYSEGASIPNPLYSLFSASNTSKNNYLLYLNGSGTWITSFAVNGSENNVTFTKQTWYTVKIVVSKTGSVNYTICPQGSDTPLANGSGTFNATADGSNYKCQGLFFNLGRGGYETRFKNVKVTTDIEVEVVSAPSVSAATSVNTTTGARTLPVTDGVSDASNSVTTYWSATTELTSDNYASAGTLVEDNSITTTSDVIYLISVSSEGTCSDGVTSDASDWDIVWESTASVSLSSITNNESSLSRPVFAITAPENHTYLAYTFTPDGGAESVRTVITSGDTYAPTAYGTLTVYTNRTGYLESSYSIPVSNIYTSDYSYDYSEISSTTPFGADHTYDISASWWTGATAYKYNEDNKNYTMGRVRIQNTSSCHLVIGYGLGRPGKTSPIQIRYMKKGNIQTLKINNTNNIGVNSGVFYEFFLGITGTGQQTDLTSVYNIPSYNTVASHRAYVPANISVSATLGTNGYTTFASPYPLDLTIANMPEGLTAYKASVDGTTVRFTELNQTVPANTGILLQGEAGETYNIPVAASGTAVTENAFLVNTGGTTFTPGDTETYYYFGLIKNSLTFGVFDPTTVAIPASKAYLKVLKSSIDAGGARLNVVFGDDEITGISDATRLEDKGQWIEDNVYNLSGQRVEKPVKGLYIVNGKKVVIR